MVSAMIYLHTKTLLRVTQLDMCKTLLCIAIIYQKKLQRLHFSNRSMCRNGMLMPWMAAAVASYYWYRSVSCRDLSQIRQLTQSARLPFSTRAAMYRCIRCPQVLHI